MITAKFILNNYVKGHFIKTVRKSGNATYFYKNDKQYLVTREGNYVYGNSPAIVYEKEVYHRPPMSAYLTIEEANEAFDKITNYYREQENEKPISTLREVEI